MGDRRCEIVLSERPVGYLTFGESASLEEIDAIDRLKNGSSSAILSQDILLFEGDLAVWRSCYRLIAALQMALKFFPKSFSKPADDKHRWRNEAG